MRRALPRVVIASATVVTLGVSLTACDYTSTEAWAGDICTSVSAMQTTSRSVQAAVADAAGSGQVGEQERQAVKQSVAALDQAYSRFAGTIRRAPQLDVLGPAANTLEEARATLEAPLDDLRVASDRLSASADQTQLQGVVQDAGTALGDFNAAAGKALDDIRGFSESADAGVKTAFEEAGSCQELRNNLGTP